MSEKRGVQRPVLVDIVSNYVSALVRLIEWDLSYGGQKWGEGHDGAIAFVNQVIQKAQPHVIDGSTLQCLNNCQKAQMAALRQCETTHANEPGCKLQALIAFNDCCGHCEGVQPP